MGTSRYPWWSYVKQIIRDYPSNCRRYNEDKVQSLTPSYSGMTVDHSDISRTTEKLAIREMPTTQQREYEAVRLACEITMQKASGAAIMKIIDLVFWKRSHTVEGASMIVRCSYRTALRWHYAFIILVAKIYGLLDN